ncbi:putative nuclease HARBI1 isoform X1 [Brienomyrus brachyistius]|uniref:putative nuclease HARBI1 isoform X1 n=1 Tax=Brienomyrus brachyistius TaxID=42636 RepID=UPI0020B3E62C|nr:putative nuclease HARBI1 isoform X1 [Brienomyrus brachyistius]XP_048870582.1 putative nuclease HARBI1 isoform X1 [Brienomyrus brachyistius]
MVKNTMEKVAFALFLFQHLNKTRLRSLARLRKRRRFLELLHANQANPSVSYAKLNRNVPVLQVYFDPEQDLWMHYRLRRRSMNELMQVTHQEKDHGWAHHLEVLVFAYWLAHGLSYRATAQTFSVPKSTVYRIVHKMAQQIKKNLHKVVSLPSPEELDAIAGRFAHVGRHSAFGKAVGAIDGCHFRIKPPKQNEAYYFNHMQFHSVQMQAICDSQGKFLDIFVGYPGSVHVSTVLRNSPVYQNASYPPPEYFILGEEEYPCLVTPICLITPYKMASEVRAEQKFNESHSLAHSGVLQAFGMMRARWRLTFSKPLEVSTAFCSDVITACAFLHNVCLMNGDFLRPEHDCERARNLVPPPEKLQAHERSGSHIRDRLAADVHAPLPLPVHLQDHDYC